MSHKDRINRMKAGEKHGVDTGVHENLRKAISSSFKAPEEIRAEVHTALDQLGAIYGIGKPVLEELKNTLDIRLSTADIHDMHIYDPDGKPERTMLLFTIKTGDNYRIDPAATYEECSHCLRSLFHPYENPMVQEFFGALGPVLGLDKRPVSGSAMLDSAEILDDVYRHGGKFNDIPDALGRKLRKFLPEDALDRLEKGGSNSQIAAEFFRSAFTHLIPAIAAESMADTGYLDELLPKYPLIVLPGQDVAILLKEYETRCSENPEWKEKFKEFKKSCGYYIKKR